MKILNVVLRIVLGLILIMPILGAFGVFPPPTADLYNTPEAFVFIDILNTTGYIMYLMAIVFAFSIFLIATNRMALVAIILFPITLNILSFHLFLDGGLFTAGAILGNVLFALNLYFFWQNRDRYMLLWR